MKFCVWDIYSDWRQVCEKYTGTCYRSLRHLQRLATGVWDVYGDLRQVFDISTKTDDRCLILGRGGTDLLLTASRNKRIQCTAEKKAPTALSSLLTNMAYMQLHYHPKHWDVGPYRTDTGCLVNSERKTAAVLINTLLCCGVYVGCVTSSVRISKDERDVMRFEVCVNAHHWYNNINNRLDATMTIY